MTDGNGEGAASVLDELKRRVGRVADHLAIDEENLPLERHKQPFLTFQAGQLYSRYLAAQAEAELVSREIESRLALEYREKGIPGGVRVTDEAVKAAVRCNPEYVTAERERIKAMRKAGDMLALRDAMREKGMSIRALEYRQGLGVAPDDQIAGPYPQSFKRRTRIVSDED